MLLRLQQMQCVLFVVPLFAGFIGDFTRRIQHQVLV